jgi:hypothetical protein
VISMSDKSLSHELRVGQPGNVHRSNAPVVAEDTLQNTLELATRASSKVCCLETP